MEHLTPDDTFFGYSAGPASFRDARCAHAQSTACEILDGTNASTVNNGWQAEASHLHSTFNGNGDSSDSSRCLDDLFAAVLADDFRAPDAHLSLVDDDALCGLPSPPRCPPFCSCVLCSLPPVPSADAPLPGGEHPSRPQPPQEHADCRAAAISAEVEEFLPTPLTPTALQEGGGERAVAQEEATCAWAPAPSAPTAAFGASLGWLEGSPPGGASSGGTIPLEMGSSASSGSSAASSRQGPGSPSAPADPSEGTEFASSGDLQAAGHASQQPNYYYHPPSAAAPPPGGSSAPAPLFPSASAQRPQSALAARLAALVHAAGRSKGPAPAAVQQAPALPSASSTSLSLGAEGEEERAAAAGSQEPSQGEQPAGALALAPAKRSRGSALLPPPPSGAADPAMLRLRLPQVTRGGAIRLVDVAAVCSAQPRGAAVAEAGGAGGGPFAGAPPPVLRVPWRLGPQAELLELSLPEDVGWEGALPARRLRAAEGQGGAEERWRDLQALAPGGVEARLKKRLLTLAEAVATQDEALFSLYLRLLQADASPCGSPMQRIAHYFTQALQARAKGTAMHMQFDRQVVPRELWGALVHYVCSLPYTEFWSRGLSYPIMAALEGAPVVHIVDFGCWSRQWVAVLKHLAERSPFLQQDSACSHSTAASATHGGVAPAAGDAMADASDAAEASSHGAGSSSSRLPTSSSSGVSGTGSWSEAWNSADVEPLVAGATGRSKLELLSPLAWVKGKEFPYCHLTVRWPAEGPEACAPRNADGSAMRKRLHVRFTAVEMPDKVPVAMGPWQPASHLQEELSLAAAELGVSLEFHTLRCSVHEFAARMVPRQPGEALAVCCALQMDAVADDNMARGGVRERFLQEVAALDPRVVTAGHLCLNTNMPFFLRRFSNSLDFYSSLFSSFDLGGPRNSIPRQVFESAIVARPLINSIACEGSSFVFRNEPLRHTRARFRRAGFIPAAYPPWALPGMREMLRVYSRGFGVELNGAGDVADDPLPLQGLAGGPMCEGEGRGGCAPQAESGMVLTWEGVPCFRATAWKPLTGAMPGFRDDY